MTKLLPLHEYHRCTECGSKVIPDKSPHLFHDEGLHTICINPNCKTKTYFTATLEWYKRKHAEQSK